MYAIAVLVATSLTACSNLSKQKERVKIVRVSIPDELLRPCPKPAFSGDSPADIAVYAVKVTDQLKICNNRINQIKSFVEQDVGSNLIGVGRGEGSETSDDTDSVEVGIDG